MHHYVKLLRQNDLLKTLYVLFGRTWPSLKNNYAINFMYTNILIHKLMIYTQDNKSINIKINNNK